MNFALNLSYAVPISGLIQLVFLIFCVKKYYKPSLVIKSYVSQKVKIFLFKLLPSIFSSGVTQINIFVGTIIASFQAGAVSYLYYADRIYQINLAIAGIAVSTVSLPSLTKAIKKNYKNNITRIQNSSVELSLLLSLPASFGLIIGAKEIVNCLFGYGSFSEEDILITAKALTYFGYGVPAFAIVKVMSNLFFARDNTKTPFYISSLIVFINLTISLIYFKKIGFIIIPIATSLSTWIGVIIYIYILMHLKFFSLERKLYLNSFKIILSTIFMGILFYYLLFHFDHLLYYSNNFKFLSLLVIIGLSALFYVLECYIFGLLKFKNFKI